MKLYYHPASTTCRPILLFAADHRLDLELKLVDLFTGEHLQPAYASINPNRLVPVLEDGDFRLTECSAILKYLADDVGSAAYPRDAKKRARVNERMDWLNTGFYRDLGYGLIYPQIFPHHCRPDETAQRVTVEWGRDKCRAWLKILDEDIIGPDSDYLCGGEITIADYFGAPLATLGDTIRLDYSAYPNVSRWLRVMRARPSWEKVNEPFYTYLVAPFRERQFLGL